MASDDANSLMQHYDLLWGQQANFRSLWNTVAQYVMPAWDNFIGEFAPGVNRNTRIFDSTAIIANERFAAAMESMLTPRSQIWHKLKANDEALKGVPAVDQYLDMVGKILFSARYHPEANFASQTDECYMSLGAFGNNLMFIDEMAGHSLRYRSVPLSELCWAVNHQGMVDTLFRKFKYTAKQAAEHFGLKNCPPSVQRTYDKNPYQEADYLHVIRPNGDYETGCYGDRGKRFESWYVFFSERSIIQRGAFRVFPCAVGRYRMAPKESYGRGPAITCFPDIRTANEMVKTGLRAGEAAVNPPILLAEESLLTNFNQRPGAINYGMISGDGKALAVPFESKSNWALAEKQLDGTRQVVRDSFLNTLFQILVQNPNMTATEALLRAQEKGELIAPAMGRQQSEFLGPMIFRELDVLREANALPPEPVELTRSGKGIGIEYTSPLARAMRAEEGTAIMNTLSDVAQMANIDPSVRYIVDLHDAAREMANIRGMPARLLRSEDQVNELLQHANDQQAAATQAAQAPQVALGAKNLAQAAQAAAGAGGSAGAPNVSQT